ncbi:MULTISPECIES: hypothetical protein [Kitasatospora]|uniref:MarR family transcriptional regulator n=1 Tax=Kitasatospora cystarginea TaxID=58350 RepID=A0ABN3F2L0_9ACTN
MPPSPLGLLEERREAARARVEDLEAELERLEGELEAARAVLERRVVAVEELAEALAPAGDVAGPKGAVVRVPPKGAVVPAWREGLDPVDALAPDYRRLVEAVGSGGRGVVGLTMREVAVAVGREPVAAVTENLRQKARRLVERGWLEVDGSGSRFMPRRRARAAGCHSGPGGGGGGRGADS